MIHKLCFMEQWGSVKNSNGFCRFQNKHNFMHVKLISADSETRTQNAWSTQIWNVFFPCKEEYMIEVFENKMLKRMDLGWRMEQIT